MSSEPIYLDNNATTPCDPRVIEKMLPYFGQVYGNPATGLHRQGRKAAEAVEIAREQVATLIGADPNEIVFTGGATESNNLAILGVARHRDPRSRRRIVTSAVEHKAVLLPCQHLEKLGFDVVVLPNDGAGRVSLDAAKQAVNDNTLLVSIQAANNEIGTIQPVAEIAVLARQAGALFHSDAAQAAGKIPVDVDVWNVDLLSISAHKFYGPKGIGALFVRGGARAIPIQPLVFGGGQEANMRSGTANVPAIVGFGVACEIALRELQEETIRVRQVRDEFEELLAKAIQYIRFNGHQENRLPNTSSFTIPDVDADALLLNMPTLMLGTGSACHAGAIEPSHVLSAIGLTRKQAHSTVRSSLGRFTTREEIKLATEIIITACYQMSSSAA
jgi:cysteine desulfurase